MKRFLDKNIGLLDFFNVKEKKILIIYLIISISIFLFSNQIFLHSHYKFMIITAAISIILGLFCLIYYLNHKDEPHKVAFLSIICFGIIVALISPIFSAPDEVEHFMRSLLTSQGAFFPNYVPLENNVSMINASGYGIKSTYGFYELYRDIYKTFFDTATLNTPIDNTPAWFNAAFLHNPFYGYLAQGFGILLANLLNLNTIWMLWLGRIFNIIIYAILVSLAIKKTPILKMPMLFMALLPLAIYQGASMSIDSMVNGLGFIVIAYFLYLYKSKENSINSKEIIIFSVLVLLLSLTKLTYLAFILLLLCIPKNKFKTPFYYTILSIVVISIITLIYSHFSTGLYDFSRQEYYILNNVNSTLQIQYLLNHGSDSIYAILKIIPDTLNLYLDNFKLYFGEQQFGLSILSLIGTVSMTIIIFLYPIKEKLNLKIRLSLLFIISIIIFGTYIIQLLKWTSVGDIYNILGVASRYFIPMFPILPLIFNIDIDFMKEHDEVFDIIVILISMIMLSALIFLLLFMFY